MKKKIIIGLILLLIMTISLLYYIFIKPELKYGFYYGDTEAVYVQLNEDNTFVYRAYLGMSTSIEGEYTIKDNNLILVSDIGTFKFKILNNKIEYIEGEGDFEGDLVKTGTIYKWKK